MSAQNTMRFSQLNFAQGVNNPSALAIDGKIMADLIFRNQWAGLEGAPTSVAFNGQYEFNQLMALGISASYDQIGVTQRTSIQGQYAFRLLLENSKFISLGLGLGINNYSSELASSSTTVPGDPAFMNNYYRLNFSGSFGVFYNAPRFYIGASIPQLFQKYHSGLESGFWPPLWHYYVTTGFYIDAGEKFTFNPHIQLKAVLNAPLQGDLILRNTFMGRFSVVVGFRSELSLIAGFDLLVNQNLRVGYSFNYDVGSLSRVKGMSNEVYLGLAFPYRSDRYDFSGKRYVNSKGGHRTDHRINGKRRQKNSGRRYGRNTNRIR